MRCSVRRFPWHNVVLALGLAGASSTLAAAPSDDVPGVVIDHSPAGSGKYIGSPSIAILPGGDYVAVHDLFGPKSNENVSAVTCVFRSRDRGKTWRHACDVQGAFWSSLFVHHGRLYLLGTDKQYGRIVIRRSQDGGQTWTQPKDKNTGVLRDDAKYHCAPVPVVEHGGRLWRGMEDAMGPGLWGSHFRAMVMSAPVDADLLRAESWTLSGPLARDPKWLGGKFAGWLEGNAVVMPDGGIVDVLRVASGDPGEKAAIVTLRADGKAASFDPATGFIDFPGGAKKFTIRFDPVSKLYWSLVNYVPEEHRGPDPGNRRNTVALVNSPDLRKWMIAKVLLHHSDVKKHGFQYLDWQFDGDDIAAVSRTAYDDGQGGARRAHDANYLTFHRISGFRRLGAASQPAPRQGPSPPANSLGMRMVLIQPGSFMMGSDDGDWDERPVHKVTISRPFFMAAAEVTNAQYEQFDPAHKKYRGLRGLSKGDGEAVIFVSWHDAVRFCEWLSAKEGRPCRLPTEAEWEYACRAGTTTAYNTGETLPKAFHKGQQFRWDPQPVPLDVGRTPPNAWGLHDMHGNVEEWCHDTYGPFEAGARVDPVGRAQGDFKVTRGGSHNTEVAFLRSANRSGSLPEDKQWLIGFRVVQAGSAPVPPIRTEPDDRPLWARDVSQARFDWSRAADPAKACFAGPQRFVHIPDGSSGPLFANHNHCPSIAWCDNGDLLAVWFSTNSERGREMTIAASRLRAGKQRWEPAAEFFKAPDRNMTGSALLNDGKGTLYHFNGLEAGGGWANLTLVMRTSADNGASWSKPRLIQPDHQPRNQVISGTLLTREGFLIQACDAVHGGNGGTAIHVSRDGGQTWTDPGAGAPKPDFAPGRSGGTIAGIHAGIVQLRDGRLLAFGRGDDLPAGDDQAGLRMPTSTSADFGKSWAYAASPWPPIDGGQRLVLMRLREGPLLFCSFTESSALLNKLTRPRGMTFVDASGLSRTGCGLFAALSLDDGKTWPVRKLITDGKPAHKLDGGAWTRDFLMDPDHAEPRGYLAATQTPDGMVHLVSSALYYRFNLAWLKTPAAPAPRS
jgi:formylglycine-generating enzyme